MKPRERRLAEGVRDLALTNPFLPERVEAERRILGSRHQAVPPVWSEVAGLPRETANVVEIRRRAEALVTAVADRMRRGEPGSDDDRALYADVASYVLYERTQVRAREARRASSGGRLPARRLHAAFRRDYAELLEIPGVSLPDLPEADHTFAVFTQIQRAFLNIFRCLVGGSLAGAKLRAAVWQSIFTHDLKRYRRALHARMGDLNTLITGPSGTGKELVARAIGFSRYVPFDAAAGRFLADPEAGFFPVNLSALSPTLIESELFGHRRGAFTGALADRTGWFEASGPYGTVFLDEIGEIEPSIQVKLLRVLQDRTCVRLGDTEPRRFEGKVVAATNRDLATEMREGRFREDLYYRLCGDVVVTPSLREQLREEPDDRRRLVRFLATRLVGEEEADGLTDDVEGWIDGHLGAHYAWPGNVRELEQCVRNVVVRREYRPSTSGPAAENELERVLAGLDMTAEELVRRYARVVHARTGTYEGAARVLGLDRRTVKAKVD